MRKATVMAERLVSKSPFILSKLVITQTHNTQTRIDEYTYMYNIVLFTVALVNLINFTL